MISASRRELLAFPLAALFNSFSMTGLLLVFGLAGRPETATDIALVQGATLALFYAFSANARNLILADAAAAGQLLRARLALMVPLAAGAWFLSTVVGSAVPALAAVLVVRRVAEWFGEIGLACHERHQRTSIAQRAVVVECLALFVCIALPFGWDVALAASAIPWALVPLLAIRGGRPLAGAAARLPLRELLPHFGSTAIIGTGTYVFRIAVALLAGRSQAGELFTAFAIGGIVPTLFGHALAPTLAHRFGAAAWPRRLRAVPALLIVFGGTLAGVAMVVPEWLAVTARSPQFWLAVGLSLVGGALMAVASALRTRLIHGEDGHQVFGPDLLANALIVGCVPLAYHLFGIQSLAGLYLLSGALSLAFLWRAGQARGIAAGQLPRTLWSIGVLLLLPVFIQPGEGLFRDPTMVFDSGREIARLPLPLSVLAVFAGIALLGNYAAATRTLTTIFLTALLFVTTAILTTGGDQSAEGAKLILLAQYLLPMFALILGEMYGAASDRPCFEQAALGVLAVVLPLQLAATWLSGAMVVQPSVFVFSIYQHLQYFPMIVAALSTMVAVGLWPLAGITRGLIAGLAPVAAVHLAASMSISALVAAGGAMAVLGARYRRLAIVVAGVSLAAAAGYATLAASGALSTALNPDGPPRDEMSWDKRIDSGSVGLPASEAISVRREHWSLYVTGATESARELLLGHAIPPDSSLYRSAYNYWLDALYNFGAIAILPLLALLGATIRLLWKRRAAVARDSLLLGSALAAAYLLLGENMLKVGMRQPYPGIITFFIWGLLLARLDRAAAPPSDGVAR